MNYKWLAFVWLMVCRNHCRELEITFESRFLQPSKSIRLWNWLREPPNFDHNSVLSYILLTRELLIIHHNVSCLKQRKQKDGDRLLDCIEITADITFVGKISTDIRHMWFTKAHDMRIPSRREYPRTPSTSNHHHWGFCQLIGFFRSLSADPRAYKHR